MAIVNKDKIARLKENNSYNKKASEVSSPLFLTNPYFDPYDIVQVKYEMLRAVNNNELSVSDTSRQFGFSRTAYYKIESRFNADGIDGLCFRKTGPKTPAKVTEDLLDFAADLKARQPDITNDEIVEEIRQQKGVTIHKRSLQREKAKKKRILPK
jgi:transposase